MREKSLTYIFIIEPSLRMAISPALLRYNVKGGFTMSLASTIILLFLYLKEFFSFISNLYKSKTYGVFGLWVFS